MAAVDTALDELIPKIGLLILNARLPEAATSPASPTHSPRRLSSAADNDDVRRGGGQSVAGKGARYSLARGPLSRAWPPLQWRADVDEMFVRDRLDFWRNGIPVTIDIADVSAADGVPRLRERWHLAYEPSLVPTVPGSADMASASDHTNVKLLTQSLYARTRLLPLATALQAKQLQREALRFRIRTSDCLAGPAGEAVDVWAAAVDGPAPRTTYRFEPAETASGLLHLHVDYVSPEPQPPTSVRRDVEPMAPAETEPPIEVVPVSRKRAPWQRPITPGSPRPPSTHNQPFGVPEAASPDAPPHGSSPLRPMTTSGVAIPSAPTSASRASPCFDDTPYRPSPRPSSSYSPHMRNPRSWSHAIDRPPAALVGSYEESLVNGRMSASPAPPIEFLAEIGVFGQGHCKPSLKCPPHRVLPCPATYYQLPNEPTSSPYVGTVDLRQGEEGAKVAGYRVPPRGILQLIIRNPNKTVVKVFLVNYNLQDMPPRSRTFVRQTSYVDDGSGHAMRFAVHVPFVSPRKGYIVVQGIVRVVFCHWMQDGNAKLRVVTAEPTPKYTLLDDDVDDSSGTDPEGAVSADVANGAVRPPSPTRVLSADPTGAAPMTLSPVATTAPTSPIRESTALTAITGAVIPMPLPLHPVSRGFVLADAPTGGPDLIAPPPALVAPLLSPERERSVPFFTRAPAPAPIASADDAMEDAADPPPAPPAW